MFQNLTDGAKGAWCMIVGTLLLTSQDAISKWMTTNYHAGEILFYRGIFSFIPIAILVVWAGNLSLLSTKSVASTLIRAVLGTSTSIFDILSYFLERSVFNNIPDKTPCSLEYDFFPQMIGKNIYGFETDGRFVDIGTPKSYLEAKKFFQN